MAGSNKEQTLKHLWIWHLLAVPLQGKCDWYIYDSGHKSQTVWLLIKISKSSFQDMTLSSYRKRQVLLYVMCWLGCRVVVSACGFEFKENLSTWNNAPGISPHSRLTNSIACSRFTSVNNRMAGGDLESLGLRNVNLRSESRRITDFESVFEMSRFGTEVLFFFLFSLEIRKCSSLF